MSKEYLEVKPDDISKLLYEVYDVPSGICEQIKGMVQRLESLDNANPSEALECLDYIEQKLGKLRYECKRTNNHRCDDLFIQENIFATIKQALLKAQENARSEEILQKYYQEGITLDSVRALKQERDNYKKILEIIKERHIDILNLEECIEREKMGNVASALEYYNENYAFNRSCELTQEEFDLLKRWLE